MTVFSDHYRMVAAQFTARVERVPAGVKAVGRGLSHSLDTFAVTPGPGEDARLLEWEGSSARAGRWSLFSLSPMEGWVGAVVVESSEAE